MAHPRFVAFLTLFGAALALLWAPLGPPRALMLGFDLAAAAFLLSLVRMMNRDGPDHIRRRAAANDASTGLMLLLASLVMGLILVTITLGLRDAMRSATLFDVGLPLVTLVLVWSFGSAVMALHYAHLYYDRAVPTAEGSGDRGGLLFPRTLAPIYWDFLYFSVNLGITYQVSDVSVTSAPLRRLVMLHCVAAFFFNIGVLAIALNIVAGIVFPQNLG